MDSESSVQKASESSERSAPTTPYLTPFLPCISHVTTILISSRSKVTRELILFFFVGLILYMFMGDNGLNTPPYPKSPPEYPDVCGKHRLKVAVQSLNQEIDFLKRELNSMEGTVPASRCCKELNEYVSTNPDPLIKVYHEKRNNSCSIWNIFRAILCCSWGWICCTRGRGCLFCPEQPKTCCCMPFENIICCRWCRVGCTGCNCCKMSSCNFDPLSPRPECSCGCVCSCSRFAETCVCPAFTGCCKIRCIC